MNQHLYFTLLGAKPKGRHTEQHDVFIDIAPSMRALIPAIENFWPEAKPKIHVDAWQAITHLDGYDIVIKERNSAPAAEETIGLKLFFINLGGYKLDHFDEYHYRMLLVAPDKATAINYAKKTAFYKHAGFEGAPSHVDDKYGVDVDDLAEVEDMLPESTRARFRIALIKSTDTRINTLHLGYWTLAKFLDAPDELYQQ